MMAPDRFTRPGRMNWLALLAVFSLIVAGCAQSPSGPERSEQGDGLTETGESFQPATYEPLTAEQQAQFDTALAASRNSRWQEADSDLSALQASRPDVPFLKARLAWVRQQQGRMEEAKNLYQQALKQDPSDTMAINNLALIMQETGEFQAASQLLKKGLRHDGDAPELHYNLAVLSELYLLDLETALEHYREYQRITATEDGEVKGWIVDLERRLQ
ncbi:tetratricopeptide repeat protein [Marinobacter sp.]|uniref:tetratricopeptide repeat protein n=1 Tax=Marinobacter sp. TaxID=50741 RepID=UPI00384ACFFF